MNACMRVRGAIVALFFSATLFAASGGGATALDRYVAGADPHYRYELVKTIPGEGYTGYVLEMTSIGWRTAAEVDRPVWKHWVTIVKPDRVAGTTGFLSINGGHIDDPAPRLNPIRVENALVTHTVVAEVFGIPNEPVTFAADGKPRSEDAIVAYTWVQFMKSGDETWPLHFAMTKASMRAMDAVTAFCATLHVRVEKYFVTGGSKRGWTTWLTAAVDPRVVGIAPMKIDLLNNAKSYEHQYRAYGAYSPAVKAYETAGLMGAAASPRGRRLMELEDPYSYRDRFTMPKFIVNGSGDQFFTPDSSRFYFDDLPGEKYLRYLPNADHGTGLDAGQTLIAYYDALLQGRARPRFSWTFEGEGEIRVTSADRPAEVKLWQATNPEARDFRVMTIGKPFRSSDVAESGQGVWVARVEKPAKGWTASFVELTFAGGGRYPLKFTTAVRITPDTLPYPAPAGLVESGDGKR